MPQIKPSLLNAPRADSLPYNQGNSRIKSTQFSYSEIKQKINSTRNAAISLGDRMQDGQIKSLTARYNSQPNIPTSRNNDEFKKLGKMRPEKKLDYIKDYLGTLKRNDPGMFDFFLTEAKSRGMLHSEKLETASMPTTATMRNLNASPS